MSGSSQLGAWSGKPEGEAAIHKTQVIKITPVAKPRMTRRDKWQKRPAVLKYRAYCDELRLKKPEPNWEKLSLVFRIPMPQSWSKKKRQEMLGKPHRQTPDLDNLIKAFQDALLGDDSKVWRYSHMSKVWATEGAITINPKPKPEIKFKKVNWLK